MKLSLVPGAFAICRLLPTADIPSWARHERAFLSVTYTAEELSIVCPAANVPPDVRCERPWSAIKVEGLLDFALTGILSTLTVPLAAANIAIFAVSTFDTDYLLVKENNLARACQVLEEAGHQLTDTTSQRP